VQALVIYESMFGNTKEIAEAIVDGLAAGMSAEAVEVGAAPKSIGGDVGLLVIGGPTHAWSMSRKNTREGAVKDATKGPISAGIGIREWIGGLGQGISVPFATFDTRFKRARWITGSAARSAHKRLERLGLRAAAPAQSFFVARGAGPLMAGELERARQWGRQLGQKLGG
jgi:flavorubredoxin